MYNGCLSHWNRQHVGPTFRSFFFNTFLRSLMFAAFSLLSITSQRLFPHLRRVMPLKISIIIRSISLIIRTASILQNKILTTDVCKEIISQTKDYDKIPSWYLLLLLLLFPAFLVSLWLLLSFSLETCLWSDAERFLASWVSSLLSDELLLLSTFIGCCISKINKLHCYANSLSINKTSSIFMRLWSIPECLLLLLSVDFLSLSLIRWFLLSWWFLLPTIASK